MLFQRTMAIVLAIGGVFVWSCSNIASADTINIDFGRQNDGFDINEATGNWNNVKGEVAILATNTTNIPDLIDDTGAMTGFELDLSYNATMAAAEEGADFFGQYPAVIQNYPAIALRDSFVVQNGGSMTAVFSNLDMGLSYDFLFYGARGGNGGGKTSWDVTGGNGTFNATIASVFMNSSFAPEVTGIRPDANGEITVVMVGDTDNSSTPGALNVMRITTTVVPEPNSILLAGLCVGTMALRRRKR